MKPIGICPRDGSILAYVCVSVKCNQGYEVELLKDDIPRIKNTFMRNVAKTLCGKKPRTRAIREYADKLRVIWQIPSK